MADVPDVAPLQFIRGRRVKDAAFGRTPKPDWLKVRAPGSENYLRIRGLMRELEAAHRVRGSALPEHRRVLAPRHGDVHDHGRRLHARVRLLQRHARRADTARRRTNRHKLAQRSTRWRSNTSSSPASTATTCPTSAPDILRRRFARSRRVRPECRVEVLIPDFQGQEEPLARRARTRSRTS